MRMGLLAAMAATCAAAQPAFAAWRYVPSNDGPTYWSTDVRRDGASAEFTSVMVQGLGAAKDGVLARRKIVQIDCAWGVGRDSWSSMDRPLDVGRENRAPQGWNPASFHGDPQDPVAATGFACAAPVADGAPVYPTLDAAVKDGIGRLGYADVEATYKINTPPPLPIPPYKRMDDTPPGFDPPGPLDLVWKVETKAVFVSTESIKRDGDTVSGQSFWVAGVGRPANERVYLLKDFAVDCRSGAVAHSTRDAWPRREGPAARAASPLKAAARTAGSAEDTLLIAVCVPRAPLQRLRSTEDLGAFAAGTN